MEAPSPRGGDPLACSTAAATISTPAGGLLMAPLPPLPPGSSTAAALALLRQHYPKATAWELLNMLAAPGWSIPSTLSEVRRLLREAA